LFARRNFRRFNLKSVSFRSLIVVLILVVIPGFVIQGCSKKEEVPPPEEAQESSATTTPVIGDWLVLRINSEPATLNPITATDAYESQINGYVYESLLTLDNQTLDHIPKLAESWSVSEDQKQLTFVLKEGLHWQDGEPLTAQDVLYTFDRARDPEVDAPHLRSYYKDLTSVEILDERTVQFTYSFPYFKALDMIGGLNIIPRHIFEREDFNTHSAGRAPIGSGPYRFSKWSTGKEIVLERYPEYWGKPHYIQRIVFRILTDETVALQVLKKGDLDFMGLQPIQWERQTKTKEFSYNFKKIRYPSLGYSYIGWNNQKDLFADKRVRRAMTMLMDRESFVKNIWYGLGTVISGNFFLKSPDYDASIEPWPYDPDGAVKLLTEAGWTDSDGDGVLDRKGVSFRFEFTYSSGSTTGEKIATMLQESLSKVGIEMSIRQLEWALFTQLLDDRAFDAVTLGWSLPVLADPYQVWHSSQAEKGSNYIGFINEETDRILEQSRTEFDREKRATMYRRFHRILHEEQPYTFLFNRDNLVALDTRFTNVIEYPLGTDSTEWWVPATRQRYR
jgi:peptide/nickel transport system substrate-binding protein